MPLEVKFPIATRLFELSDETLKAIVAARTATWRDGKERGFDLCRPVFGSADALTPGTVCSGSVCSVPIRDCYVEGVPEAGRRSATGSFHTHPGNGPATPSVGDYLYEVGSSHIDGRPLFGCRTGISDGPKPVMQCDFIADRPTREEYAALRDEYLEHVRPYYDRWEREGKPPWDADLSHYDTIKREMDARAETVVIPMDTIWDKVGQPEDKPAQPSLEEQQMILRCDHLEGVTNTAASDVREAERHLKLGQVPATTAAICNTLKRRQDQLGLLNDEAYNVMKQAEARGFQAAKIRCSTAAIRADRYHGEAYQLQRDYCDTANIKPPAGLKQTVTAQAVDRCMATRKIEDLRALAGSHGIKVSTDKYMLCARLIAAGKLPG